jgi:hypothetical protein
VSTFVAYIVLSCLGLVALGLASATVMVIWVLTGFIARLFRGE